MQVDHILRKISKRGGSIAIIGLYNCVKDKNKLFKLTSNLIGINLNFAYSTL